MHNSLNFSHDFLSGGKIPWQDSPQVFLKSVTALAYHPTSSIASWVITTPCLTALTAHSKLSILKDINMVKGKSSRHTSCFWSVWKLVGGVERDASTDIWTQYSTFTIFSFEGNLPSDNHASRQRLTWIEQVLKITVCKFRGNFGVSITKLGWPPPYQVVYINIKSFQCREVFEWAYGRSLDGMQWVSGDHEWLEGLLWVDKTLSDQIVSELLAVLAAMAVLECFSIMKAAEKIS